MRHYSFYCFITLLCCTAAYSTGLVYQCPEKVTFLKDKDWEGFAIVASKPVICPPIQQIPAPLNTCGIGATSSGGSGSVPLKVGVYEKIALTCRYYLEEGGKPSVFVSIGTPSSGCGERKACNSHESCKIECEIKK